MPLVSHLRRPPIPSRRVIPVWQRNFRVWRKLLLPSLMGNFGEPLFYLLALGYGFGTLVGQVNGLPYRVFLGSGIVCSSAMTAASFEALYSAYTRMAMQQSWSAMLNAPLEVDDIILGEILWAATKALVNSTAILIVAALLGLVYGWQALLVLPVVFVAGLCFAAIAMVVTTLSRSYSFFEYYFTLVMTPMLLLSGVFFPLHSLPPIVADGALLLPLAHIVMLVRPLMAGDFPTAVALHLAVALLYALLGFWIATSLARRRLQR